LEDTVSLVLNRVPLVGNGKTLVTSRFQGWKDTFVGVDEVVENFEEEETHTLLTDEVEHWCDHPAAIKDVSHRLTYFPLALASAADCPKAYRLDPHEYIAELEHCRSKLLGGLELVFKDRR